MIIGKPEQKSNDKESKSHINGKVRVARLVDDYLRSKVDQNKYIVEYEHEFPKITTALGPREYIADIFVQVFNNDRSKCIDIELDGKLGHWNKLNKLKDNVRDYSLVYSFACPVIRLNTYWVSGYRPIRKTKFPRKKLVALSNEEIFEELQLVKHLF